MYKLPPPFRLRRMALEGFQPPKPYRESFLTLGSVLEASWRIYVRNPNLPHTP